MTVIKKVKQGQKNFKSLIFSVEELLQKTAQHLFPDNWDNEEAAALLCRSAASYLDTKTVEAFGTPLHLRALSYKNVSEEKRFCSIGIHVTITFQDRQELSGMSFYDLHLRDPHKHTFSSIRMNHLRSINAHAHQARLLLVDYEPVPIQSMAVGPDFLVGGSPHSWHHWMPVTNAAAVPVEAVIQLGEKSRALYKMALPFSYQMVFRHPFGLDLQHNEAALNILTGKKIERGNPSHILQVSAFFTPSAGEMPHIGLSDTIFR